MILYLRIVHSVDYYSANEYPNEDEMPHRCGIMHARGPSPSTKINETEVSEWTQNFENKLKHFIELQDKVEDEEAVKLGKKDPEAYPLHCFIKSSLAATIGPLFFISSELFLTLN
ncbi:hypothetical protein KUTeg_000678 [Tegillarca granosa]|uniref:SERRATE/Ars2 C-terminal domain-containing protein n=1 Tax=Tegillarca granosa TaxID=220873 RepID=A0ABQ9FY81_TEGGR|nr:hypothetical protein KUTeg_000678 [Tegillarca granosa]